MMKMDRTLASHQIRALMLLVVFYLGSHGSALALETQRDRTALHRLAIHLDNDEFTGNRPDDRWYSSGGRIDWLSLPHKASVGAVSCSTLPSSLSQAGTRRFGSFGQDIYAQNDRLNTVIDQADRPIGAYLYVQRGRSAASPLTNGRGAYAMAKLEVGVTGPAALGEQVQNGLHDLLGVERVEVWGNQIRPRLGVNLHISCTALRAHVDPEHRNPLVLHAGYHASIGNILVEAGLAVAISGGPDGARMRLPQTARLANPITPKIRRWGVIAGVSVRAVAWDALIDGDTFGYDNQIRSRPLQAAAFIGIGISLGSKWQLSYALMRRTLDFEGPGVDAQNFRLQTIGQLILQAPFD
ncbi:MAG: lipid A deacylase LpxR family protein [Burkholderiaceae bacterium]